MPCLRHNSATGTPASCSFRIPMICSSVYRDRFIRPSPSGPDSNSSWPSFRGARQCTQRADRRLPTRRSNASVSSTTSRSRSTAHRRRERQKRSKPIAAALAAWADETRRKLSRKSELAAAFRYMRVRWTALIRCFDDGRLALDNNPAERALRCVAIGRKNYLFAGSDAGGRRAAAMYSLTESAKLNGLNPQHYLPDLLARIP